MTKSPRKFGQLLTEAILRIKSLNADKNIEMIQFELGEALGRSGRSAIYYWRDEHIPEKEEDIEKLAREIIKRSDLERAWLEEFLKSAGYRNRKELCDELFSSNALDGPSASFSPLPGRTYKQLIGRDKLLFEILSALHESDRYRIVTIDGMGGIGKSALALEIANKCMGDPFFESVVWIGAATENESSPLTFDSIINAIAAKLGLQAFTNLSAKKKKEQIDALLHTKRILLVVDNLDIAKVSQSQVIIDLQPILGYSKALLTSRQRFSGDVFPIHLIGLDTDSSKSFIVQEGGARNISHINTLNDSEYMQVIETTGGSPLAMKLVVGQIGHLPLNIVLAHLRKVKPLQSNLDEDEYISFYKFIFLRSWDLLSESGKNFVLVMARFPPETGGRWEAIKEISHANDDILSRNVDELWRLAFIEVGEISGLESARYYLHTLTKNFVLSDIVKLSR